MLYILLSLEAYSLLIGSLMLFVALAAVMYLTRNLNWGGGGGGGAEDGRAGSHPLPPARAGERVRPRRHRLQRCPNPGHVVGERCAQRLVVQPGPLDHLRHRQADPQGRAPAAVVEPARI